MDIFLSRPTRIATEFESGLTKFIQFLWGHKLNPRTLGTTDYPTESPMKEVISLLQKCSGTIVLGYPQIYVEQGKVHGQQLTQQLVLSTEWNHIEAALSYALQKPILVIHHQGITRGVFDRGTTGSFIHEVDFSDPEWSKSRQIIGAFESWKKVILR